MKRRRSRLELVADLLEAVEAHPEAPPTRLAQYVNTSYDRLSRLLDELESRGLVSRSSRGYSLTPEGRRLLRELKRLRRIITDFGLEDLV